MKVRFDGWEKIGLLNGVSEDRKLFVSNSLELLTKYSLEANNVTKQLVTILYPIFIRIGRECDFGINNFFDIINEVRDGIETYQTENIDDDKEMMFVEEYSERKISELKKC